MLFFFLQGQGKLNSEDENKSVLILGLPKEN